ncbi:MAG: glycoside hydrolase 43 family protein [Melioribacteraceae bacterium]|nr:glycoside hydrolase 43 family protein [Melioribacteraceae bacterium]
MRKLLLIISVVICLNTSDILAQNKSTVWNPNIDDTSYLNPIIHSDYSDPDICRVGDDYYMTSSSFSHFPGLPILHSKDLVNWKLISHAVINYPVKAFAKPQHGGGIWAPSIRYHNNEFYIYFGDPDNGIFMTKSKNAEGPWEPLYLVKEAKGWIDPSPFWDDDGKAYLVRAWARSRSGIKHILTIHKMSSDGKTLLDNGVNVFSDSLIHPTIEGPKLYKRNGYYYIFAPAGGVKPGWQTILRSKNIYGPYEDKIVLELGSTKINGPHQGGWVTTQSGEDWFIHFQDRYAYGRIVHLQPMRWENDWPVMGNDYDGNGIGEPVSNYRKPYTGKNYSVEVPQTSDDFNSDRLGLQWQWQANFDSSWYSLRQREGSLRLLPQKISNDDNNLYNAPFLLMQKFPAKKFSVSTKIEFENLDVGDRAGLIVFGFDYSFIGVERHKDGFHLTQIICNDANKKSPELRSESIEIKSSQIHLRMSVKPEDDSEIIPKVICKFSYSIDGEKYLPIGKEFIAKEGRWVGAKVGLFASSISDSNGYADFEWFRFE